MTKNLIVAHHLGLGDVFCISPAIRYLCKKYENVYVFSKSEYFENTLKLYHDVDNLSIIEIEDSIYAINYFIDNFKEEKEVYKCGIYKNNDDLGKYKLPDIFYEQINIPVKVSSTHFNIDDEVIDDTVYNRVKEFEYIFVNAKSSGTNHIHELKKIIPNDRLILNPNYNHYKESDEYYEIAQQVINLPLFSYVNIIKNAKEFYGIGHLFSILGKFLCNEESKKVIYNYNKINLSKNFFEGWEIYEI
jgi:hypothetical protein